MPKVALCCDVFASGSVADCGNLYLLFIAVIGEGCRSSQSDSVPLCCHLNVCENCFVYREFHKAGVLDLWSKVKQRAYSFVCSGRRYLLLLHPDTAFLPEHNNAVSGIVCWW